MTGWTVYILRCRDRTLYTGATNDLKGRLRRHNAGAGAKYTRGRRPVVLVYTESASSRGTALKREAAIKRLKTADKRRLIARGAQT